jgi:AraC family transcriptional regulator of adaptative response/methylated-DNA-[protein]-cysteine methyltransferase
VIKRLKATNMRTSARLKARAAATVNDPRWAAVVTRDAAADGEFFYAVKTTGVYCRPSCASRLARPENVQFYATRGQAERAGFRPCKRCKPDQLPLAAQHAVTVAKTCRLIEHADTAPSLAALANHAGMSTYHFHRIFKAVTGVTPGAYAAAHRARRVRTALKRSASVTDAIFDAGYQSSGRFYEKSNALLGMTPSTYRAGGKDMTIKFAVGECSLGSILVASSERGVCAILMGDDPAALARDLQERFPRAQLMGGGKKFARLVANVVGFVEAPARGWHLPLDVRGTAFQQRVWQALQKIPPGSTATYTQIAQRIGALKAVRAVAGACAANALAVAIPCHRVVRSDGGLAGYRWGVARKRALLRREVRR